MRRVALILLCGVLTATCSALNRPDPPVTSVPCTKSDASALLGSFIRAIDSGDGQTITSSLATAVVFSDDRRQIGGDFASPRDRDAIVRYFLDRHAAGERFELSRGQANTSRDFEYDVKVSVVQVGVHVAIGKAATNDPADCSDQRIAAWNMVRQP